MYRSLKAAMLAGALAVASGCVVYEIQPKPRVAMPVPSGFEVHQQRRMPLEEIGREEVGTVSKRYRHERIMFRYDDAIRPRTNIVEWYMPCVKAGENVPVIAILPILGGGKYELEEHFARVFAKRGYAAVIPRRLSVKEEVHALEDIDLLLKESVLDVQRLYDWMGQQKEIDTKCFGLFGISFGAIRGVLATALESRVKASVLGLGGGDLAYIFVHTTEKGLVQHRDRVLQKHNFSLQQGEDVLRAAVSYEPLVLARSIDTKKVFMVQATRDTVVPTRTGDALWEMLGRPKRMKVWAGHYSSLLYLPCIDGAVMKFFDEKLRK